MRIDVTSNLSEELAALGIDSDEIKKIAVYFDPEFYGAHSSEKFETSQDAFRHFMLEGWEAKRDPSETFSVEAYCKFYPEVEERRENPLTHYALSGRQSGYFAHRIEALRDISDAALEYVRPFFEPDYYAEQAKAEGWSDEFSLKHYMAYGWKQGLDPARDFSTSYYLENNRDIREAGSNPFLHFHIAGAAEGRDGHPDPSFRSLAPEVEKAVTPYFNPEFYRASNPELNPLSDNQLLRHYMNVGWREARDPSPKFSTAYYLTANSDIAGSELNPLLHYSTSGQAEGRYCHPDEADEARLNNEMKVAAPFFDADFYAKRNPSLHGNDDELLRHFLTVGWKEGQDPAPEFSTSFYLETYKDVADAGSNPLVHYAISGRKEGRNTQLNASKLALTETELSSVRAFFDPQFYRDRYPDVSGSDEDLLRHYLSVGWREKYDPSPRFSTSFYLKKNSDIRKAGLNPLIHYAISGQAEGRKAFKGQLVSTVRNKEHKLIKPFFDAAYYRTQIPQREPDYDASELLVHYLEKGWKKGLNPSAEFSTRFYLDTYPDIRKGGLNPLLHYAVAGKAEGRKAHPGQAISELSASDIAQVESLFDPDFYRAMNDDVSGTDQELLLHYMSFGWRDGRDPAADFSTKYYIDTYPDIRGNRLNPLLHYAKSGKAEGRRPIAKGPIKLRQLAGSEVIPEHMKSILGLPEDAPKASLPANYTVNPKTLELHWVIPDFDRGGGGHMTIFRMIRHLEIFGHTCKIWIEHPRVHKTSDEAYQDIVKYFQCVQADVAFVKDGFSQTTGDAVIATGWSTAYLAESAKGFAAKFYFVQDHEVEFYPTGSERLMAQRTYEFDFASICASPWLEKIMSQNYGRWARHFYLAYDREEYRITDPAIYQAKFSSSRETPVKIAVYARGHTARRCVDLALASLELLAKADLDFEVHFFGQEKLPFSITPFTSFNHGVLAGPELARLYSDCDLGICFSATNYSLVPQEMMACGLPLIELHTESTQEIFPQGAITLAGPDPEDIAAKLAGLIGDAPARRRQAENALKWVDQFTWEKSARDVEMSIIEYLSDRAVLRSPTVHSSKSNLIDVIIPTYNGMGELEQAISSLRGQKHADQMQIFCIDSSSSDGTTEWLKAQKDISTTVIDQNTFQHGRTRNDAIAQGTAEFIGVLTQDAVPATEFWATDILKMFNHYPEAAGLFGRHLPDPHHPKFVQQEILNHFDNMLEKPLAVSKYTDLEKWEKFDQGWHQFLHFYSDNNSAMRRAIWQNIPYPEVDYGEDQVWAYQIIKAGYTKLYAPTVTVYHSHDYDPVETYKRSHIEGAFFHTHFGYELGRGTAKQVAKRIEREQQAFRNWARQSNVGKEETERRLRNIKEKYRGWRDGVAQSKASI